MRGAPRIVVASLLALTTAAASQRAPAQDLLERGQRFTGHAGHRWTRDHGVLAGRCDTAAVLAVVGSARAAAAGAPASERDIGMLVNATVGAVIGASPSREIDGIDQACIGQALELAPPGRVVCWTSTATRVAYTLTVVRNVDSRCREFRLVARRGGREEVGTQAACSDGDGRWRIR